jgi:release factor glutamine methyltransferase
LKVTPDVLLPRPETEELVHWILKDFENSDKREIRILDIGTGSGCIAIALKKKLKSKAVVYASDISIKALDIAKENSLLSGVDIHFIHHDILSEEVLIMDYLTLSSVIHHIYQKSW